MPGEPPPPSLSTIDRQEEEEHAQTPERPNMSSMMDGFALEISRELGVPVQEIHPRPSEGDKDYPDLTDTWI